MGCAVAGGILCGVDPALNAAKSSVVEIRSRGDGDVEVLTAPVRAYFSLDLVNQADLRAIRASGDEITVGSGAGAVSYRVVGWNADRRALVAKKAESG